MSEEIEVQPEHLEVERFVVASSADMAWKNVDHHRLAHKTEDVAWEARTIKVMRPYRVRVVVDECQQ